MTHAGDDPMAGATAGWRELDVEGMIGVVALFFLVKYANGGINGYWWACLAIFGVGLVSWLRDLRRAWIRRK